MTRNPNDPPLFFEQHVFVCTNRREPGHRRGCCAEKDSEKLRDYMKIKVKEKAIPGVRINTAGCLDRCEEGPCFLIYPDGIWYSCKTKEDVDAVIQQHLVEGKRASHLMIDKK